MASELDETFNGPDPTPVVIVPEPVSVAETEEDLDLIAEQVGLLSLEEEERADHIMEGIVACREKLESLSTLTTSTESPLLNQIVTDLAEIKAAVALLLSEHRNPSQSLSMTTSNPPPSDSMSQESRDEPELVASTDDQNMPAPRVKRNRAI
jgi:hypothetical protein